MQYVNLGSAGVKVSTIAMGLGFRQQSSEREAQHVIEHAIDSGVNFLDCANNYSLTATRKSEEVLGRVLETKRNDVVITSKVNTPTGQGPNDRGTSRYHVMREVDNSLRRLGTDHVDVYLLHAFDDETPLDETLRAMDDIVTAGKARYVGCCNFTAWQVCKALWTADRLNAAPIICVQNPYSLLNRALENELFGLLRDQGLGAMAYSPMAVARLTGARALDASEPAEANQVVTAVREIAAERGKTMAQVALNWVLSHDEITVAIAGCDTVEQVDENVGALGWELDEPELARLNKASESLRGSPVTG